MDEASWDALREAVEGHPFVRGLAPEQRAALIPLARWADFQAGAFVLREGAPAEVFYLLVSGRVALEVASAGRGAVRVESLGGGELLGLHWLFPPRRWVLDARALEPTRAVEIDAARLRALMEEDVALGYAVSTRLLEQLYQRLERVRLQRLDVYGVGR